MKTLEKKNTKAAKAITSTEISDSGEVEVQFHPDQTATMIVSGELAIHIEGIAKRMGIPYEEVLTLALAFLEKVADGIIAAARPAFEEAEPGTRPIMFPADKVKLLEELLEASGTNLSLDDYAAQFLGDEITASLGGSCSAGVPEILDGSYVLEPGDREAMQAVVERWKANAGGAA